MNLFHRALAAALLVVTPLTLQAEDQAPHRSSQPTLKAAEREAMKSESLKEINEQIDALKAKRKTLQDRFKELQAERQAKVRSFIAAQHSDLADYVKALETSKGKKPEGFDDATHQAYRAAEREMSKHEEVRELNEKIAAVKSEQKALEDQLKSLTEKRQNQVWDLVVASNPEFKGQVDALRAERAAKAAARAAEAEAKKKAAEEKKAREQEARRAKAEAKAAKKAAQGAARAQKEKPKDQAASGDSSTPQVKPKESAKSSKGSKNHVIVPPTGGLKFLDSLTTKEGTTFRAITVKKKGASSITLVHNRGTSEIPLHQVRPEDLKKLGYSDADIASLR